MQCAPADCIWCASDVVDGVPADVGGARRPPAAGAQRTAQCCRYLAAMCSHAVQTRSSCAECAALSSCFMLLSRQWIISTVFNKGKAKHAELQDPGQQHRLQVIDCFLPRRMSHCSAVCVQQQHPLCFKGEAADA